jgi:hypothetical protein
MPGSRSKKSLDHRIFVSWIALAGTDLAAVAICALSTAGGSEVWLMSAAVLLLELVAPASQCARPVTVAEVEFGSGASA